MNIYQYLRKLDWIMISSSIFLVCFGLLSIFSSSLGKGDSWNFKKQIIFFGVGIFVMIVFSLFDWRYFRENSYLIVIFYFISLLSLIGLFFFAPEIRGTKSWYKIGPFSIDPVEFLKLILVIVLAKYFSIRHVEVYRIRHIFLSGLYIILPAILIFFQPNLGAVLILICLWLGVLFVSGIKIRHFLILTLLGAVVFAASWATILRDYQKERILSFVQPQLSDPLRVGWNQRQSKIAVGSGGIFGQGIGRGSQTQYGFLPEPQTDFIFAAIAEETGLTGVSVLFFLFLILIWRIMKISFSASNNFSRLFAIGISTLLVSQIFINIGMNIGILPIIGIPLPLVSYGGSGLILTFLALGVLQNIKMNP